MPRTSRKKLNKELEEKLKEYFSFLISSLNSREEIEGFFEDFLTTEERRMLSKRLMLHLMLENNYRLVDISCALGISNETIRTHKNLWQRGGIIYKRIIQKLGKREITKKLWKKIEKILKPVDLFLQSKRDMKARAKFISGDWE